MTPTPSRQLEPPPLILFAQALAPTALDGRAQLPAPAVLDGRGAAPPLVLSPDSSAEIHIRADGS